MKTKIFFVFLFFSIAILSSAAMACPVSPSCQSVVNFDVMYGDQDQMGANVNADGSFNWLEVVSEFDDPAFTDEWMFDSISLTINIPAQSVNSASVIIGHGGDGFDNYTNVESRTRFYLNGELQGPLSYGEYHEPCKVGNFYVLDTFDVTGALLPGINTFDLNIYLPGHDGWALDFIEVKGVGANCAPVPEPTTMLLSGLGLMAMAFYLRRRRKFAD